MKRKPELRMKCLSGLAALTLVATSVMSAPVMAEEGWEDMEETEFQEESVETESAEEALVVYVITDFLDFHKTDEGKFVEKEMEEKYGEMSVLPGTSLEQLDLPDKLVIDGYWQADGTAETLELKEIEWELKSDIAEVYSEASPEGAYTFVPDLDSYLLEHEGIDEFLMADDSVKLPEIQLTVAALPETDEEETQSSDAFFTEDGETDTEEDVWTEGNAEIPTEGEIVESPADEEIVEIPTEGEAPGTLEEGQTENTETTNEQEDIFAGLDDTILNAESGDISVYNETEEQTNSAQPDDAVIEIPEEESTSEQSTEETEESTNVSENVSEENAETENTDVATADITPAGSTESTDAATTENTESTDTTATESTESTDTAATESTESADTTPVADTAEAAKAAVSLNIADANGNVLYSYTDVNGTLSLTADAADVDHTVTVPAINGLYCGAELAHLKLVFAGSGDAAGRTYVLAQLVDDGLTSADTWDFTDGQEKTFRLIEYQNGVATGNTYTVKFTGITKNEHSWLEATCTTPKTCSVCGAVEGEALGHDWVEATCTTPKTCQRCGATEGKALGHDLRDNWVTVEESTDTTHGKEVRCCNREGCDYYEERALNIIGDPANNKIVNLEEGGQYELNTRLTFTASGAAMGNTEPIDGDVRYVPLSWSIQGTQGSFLDGFTGAFSITKAGTYTVTVVFQKQIYGNGSWQAADVTDSKSVTFTVGNLVQGNLVGTADGVRINPQTGDDTPIVPLAIAVVAALAVIIGVVLYKRKKK